MAKTSTYWDKRALKRLSDAEKMSEEYLERIKKIYKQAYRNIDRDIAKVYKNYAKDTGLDVDKLKELLTRSQTDKLWEQMKRQGLDKYIKNNYKARISRLEQIQAQIYAEAKRIYPKEELEQTMCYKGVINDSYYKAVYDTQMGTGLDFAFTKIDKNMTTALLNEKWSGLNYSQRIWGNTDILAESLSEIVGGAMLSGQSIAKTSKQIRERFNVSQYYAERLVRTETNHFHNRADAMAYEDMGVDMYVFVAVLDNRTSEKCQSMDGKKFAYKDLQEGVNYPPLHPNCRSKTRGYIDEETEKSLHRRARNPITGKNEVIGNMSYKDWLAKQKVKYSEAEVNKSFKMAKNKSADKKQYDRYVNRLGAKKVGTFDNFRNIKYNGEWNDLKRQYSLKRHYDISIANGDLDSLVDFELYNKMDKQITDSLHGKKVNEIEIKNHSYHFIDRVFGSVEQRRNGVSLTDITNTLNKPARQVTRGNSTKFYGENNIISINHTTGNLIQVNPY